MDDRRADRAESTALAVLEIARDLERAQIAKGVPDVFEARSDGPGAQAERGTDRPGRLDAPAGIRQERGALAGIVRSAVGSDERLGLADLELEELDGLDDLLLLDGKEPRQGQRQRRADRSVLQSSPDPIRQVPAERVATGHPDLLLVQEARDDPDREAVVVDQGPHDPGLVESRDRPRR